MIRTQTPGLENIRTASEAAGLACRGAFHPEPSDAVPALRDHSAVATIVLFGFAGHQQWPAFASSPERADGGPNPLDRWSRRMIDEIAARYGAMALYPFDGPPWLPFRRWAMRAEPVHLSPLGILIHPDWGLWHAYRGALALRERLPLPVPEPRPSPCSSCIRKPCLHTCPVRAVSMENFDAHACVDHVASKVGADCRYLGCRARRSCPVGEDHRYSSDQASFHMEALLASDQFLANADKPARWMLQK